MMKTFAKNVICAWLLPMVMAGVTSGALAETAVRPEVQKPLVAAQEALKNNQVEQALRLAAEAAAMPSLSASEQQLVWRLQAVAALRSQQWGLAIERLEGVLALPDVPTADKLALMESLVNASIQNKDPARTVRVARQYLQSGGTHPGVRMALLQSLSQRGEHQALVQEMNAFLEQDAAQSRKTPEAQLRLLALAHQQLKDDAGYFAALKKLLALYPSKAYWADAIARLPNLPGFNPRYELDCYRLFVETDNLEDAGEYVEMAGLAMKAGLPAEALRILNAGYDKGVLGQGSDAGTHARLRSEAQKKQKEDDVLLPQLEQGAKDANAWAAVGETHASKQSWGAANAAFARALAMGGVRREAELRLHYGIGLFKVGQQSAALAQWQAIQADPSAIELAALWRLHAR